MRDILEETPKEFKFRRKEGQGVCTFCPPNRGENARRNSKYYSKSWKDKTKKRKQWEKNV